MRARESILQRPRCDGRTKGKRFALLELDNGKGVQVCIWWLYSRDMYTFVSSNVYVHLGYFFPGGGGGGFAMSLE